MIFYINIMSNINTNKIISLEYIKNYLRIDHNYDDEFLLNCLSTALIYANNFMNTTLQKQTNISNDLKQALLYHIATIYENKNGNHEIPQASKDIYNLYRNVRTGL